MTRCASSVVLLAVLSGSFLAAQDKHDHGAPEQLGTVSFATSCKPGVQREFNRGVALLHSFAYTAAEETFREVARKDDKCAMAHWGIAMAYFRQLWDPPLMAATIPAAQREIETAEKIEGGSARERKLIEALDVVYGGIGTTEYRTRILKYEQAMAEISKENPQDAEAQVFYALALLASASPKDKTHANQKKAADLLEPLWRANPQHPGIPHYLIHAYDNAELAQKGLPAARSYSKIAPSAPHALHMPSHIYTRLGLWEDSIASNLAAKEASRQHGDVGEELHAMDYLVYAYLQMGRDAEAARIIGAAKGMPNLSRKEFKIAYASTAMPIRYAVERGDWAETARVVVPEEAPLQVRAIAVWARGIGLARSGRSSEAHAEIEKLVQLEAGLRAAGNEYWATQTEILRREVTAWTLHAEGRAEEAVAMIREAADQEDAVQKLPVTPGPIVPAREQLGYLLLEENQPELARREFERGLAETPGRRGALEGIAQAGKAQRQGE
jgi:tetratricopeptide (TPR) repeat protein